MATLTEANRNFEFLQSAANHYRSFETQVFDSDADWGDAAIPAGQVYAIVGGDAVAWDGDATDGSEDAAGILCTGIDALATATETVLVRDAEGKRYKLTYDGTDAELDATLLALGIIVRD